MPRRKGISPVIATVIIVAVTIAVAIAVAFWMTGIVGLFTAVEKLEIVSLTVQPSSQGSGWSIDIVVKNAGTTPTTIDQIIINNVLAATLNTAGNALVKTDNCQGLSSVTAEKVRLNPGDQATITLTLSGGQSCGATSLSPGVSIEIKLHSTGGKEYPKLATLP